MEKNPFSLYDFLGYAFPGGFALFICIILYNINGGIECYIDDYSISNIVGLINVIISSANWIVLVIYIFFSYIIGHLIAYLSALTVEKFSLWCYGFPSDYLLEDVNTLKYWTGKDINSCKSFVIYCWRIFIAILLLPITICHLLFGELFCVKYFVIKKLDDPLIETINDRVADFIKYLKYNTSHSSAVGDSKIIESDISRSIQHYEYEKQIAHRKKMDNYIALYGFLRSITFICNFTFCYLITFVFFKSNLPFIIVLALLFVTYTFYMAFLKFYRRYTLESFMCLVIDQSYINGKESQNAETNINVNTNNILNLNKKNSLNKKIESQ